jgi:CRP/FNR family cyclic AMP-dependent transcriptional regulator
MKDRSSDTPAEIEQRLAAHPFLKGMGAQQLSLLAQSASPTHFEAGQVIFRTGEPANGFYLIESGNVVLESSQGNAKPVIVDIVTAGEPLGWSWIFEPYHWQFDARATEPTRAICFSGILLRQHRDEDLTLSHELFKKMCEVMVRRLQHARARLASEKQSEA